MEPEYYQDIAITEWLPRRWEDAKFDKALLALASRFESRHRDPWLRDVLATPRSDRVVRGWADLSEAVKANLADQSDRALLKAPEASRNLRAAGDYAGALRGDLEHVYALYRAVQTAPECVQKAIVVQHNAQAMNYRWILGQASLEEGNCRSLLADFDAAHRDMSRALAQVTQAGYSDLELRAAGILSNLQTEAGNALVAWDLNRDGLATYWSGPFPGTRAYQNYFNLFRSAEGLGQVQTAYVFGRAATMAIAETPRRRTEAISRAQVARLALAAGWKEEAKDEYKHAATLFDQLRQTKTDQQYRALAELYRAEAELIAGTPQVALSYLDAVRPQIENMGAALVRISFHMDVGDALWQRGRRQDAEPAYRRAVELSERHLSTLRDAPDRAGLMMSADRAYRGLVELYWERRDVAGALRLWEWFRAGELVGPRGTPDLDRRLPQLSHESFLSYAILPGGIVAWVFDDRGVEGRRLAVKREELETVATRFLRECADPLSSSEALHRDARQLYDWLVAPLAYRLDSTRTLVFEPDGAIGAIPMQVLMDANSQYLGERFAITVSGGLADYQVRAGAGPVTYRKVLVVASPALGVEMSRTFPPLHQTLLEGSSVAAQFEHSVLLTGNKATFAQLERYRPEVDLFHFAGHGFSNANNGGLLLAPEETGSDGTGVLDGKRLRHQDWSRCRLAVLSACSTGTGEIHGPVNPESLVRNLLWAGVSRVIATRWNVDADTSVVIMNQFYKSLSSGSNVAASLQQAAGRLRENRATSHPYYWAGFQSFGSR